MSFTKLLIFAIHESFSHVSEDVQSSKSSDHIHGNGSFSGRELSWRAFVACFVHLFAFDEFFSFSLCELVLNAFLKRPFWRKFCCTCGIHCLSLLDLSDRELFLHASVNQSS